jgi:hypothetical protein
MITALGGTVAPFAQAEKPQVFPRPATSFIKNSHEISMLEVVGGERRRFREVADGTVMPVLIGIFAAI